MKRAVRSCTALALATVAGCTLFTDTEDLAGGLPFATPLPSEDGARRDASLADNGSLLDAGPDTFDPRPFCERAAHTFCVDFPGPTVTAQWTRRQLDDTGGATMDFVPGEGAAQRGAVAFGSPGVGGADQSPAYLERREDGPSPFRGTTTKLEFAIRADAFPEFHSSILVKVLTGNAIFYLKLENTGMSVYFGFYGSFCGSDSMCQTGGGGRVLPLKAGVWTPVKLAITPSDGGLSHMLFTVDGRTEAEQDLPSVFRPEEGGPNPFLLAVGLFALNNGIVQQPVDAPYKVLFDDIALDVSK